jgi:hypothetical protein
LREIVKMTRAYLSSATISGGECAGQEATASAAAGGAGREAAEVQVNAVTVTVVAPQAGEGARGVLRR